jgi:hemerythrin
MTHLIWTDAFSTTIQELDDQHRHFFDIINRLGAAHGTNAERSVMRDTFSELIDYIQVHFTAEEELLERYRYPALERHKALHALYSQKVAELFRDYLNDHASITQTTLQFLQDWIVSHILEDDMKYRDFLPKTRMPGDVREGTALPVVP